MAKNRWGNILTSLSNSLQDNEKKRSGKTEGDPLDILPESFKTIFTKDVDKDRQVNKEKDDLGNENNYLAWKKPNKKQTPTEYNDEKYEVESSFSSPTETQNTNVSMDMDGYEDEAYGGVSYDDPVISTKPTPTSEKLGLPRPGPSSFIQTARYNPETQRLNIQYTDGKVFPYYDVSQGLADKILKEKSYHSPGQTLLNTIFKGYGTTKGDQIDDIEEGM